MFSGNPKHVALSNMSTLVKLSLELVAGMSWSVVIILSGFIFIPDEVIAKEYRRVSGDGQLCLQQMALGDNLGC